MTMQYSESSFEKIDTVASKLLAYCQANEWKGYDPYDALNSKAFKFLPFLDFRLPRLVLTQILKRSPINLRSFMLIPKTENPKAIALFLMALLKLSRLGIIDEENLIKTMADRLVALRSRNTPYWCWGYSFPWQTRNILVPRWAPNLVCTSFVANALLDAYERNGELSYLSRARSAAEYIQDVLHWKEDDRNLGFCYPLPSMKSRIHNANLMGAALLCRVYKHCQESRFLDPALEVARYSAAKQHRDGSWDYGEWPHQRWTDNFHTGYNLCALRSISEYIETMEFEQYIRRGFEFYRKHLIREDGVPKYFHDCEYPFDIHSAAQSIITLLRLADLYEGSVEMAFSIFDWVISKMWNGKGYFYYQIMPHWTNRIPYMRWSQAWMLLATTMLLEHCDTLPEESLAECREELFHEKAVTRRDEK